MVAASSYEAQSTKFKTKPVAVSGSGVLVCCYSKRKVLITIEQINSKDK